MRARPGELSANAAVLGLLVERPDSIAGLTNRLPERFPQARFSERASNAVHKALPSLYKQGLVRVVEHRRVRSLDLYQATEAGCRSYREALRAAAAAIPTIPDALRAWLEEVGDEAELRDFLDVVRQLEAACSAEWAAARKRFLQDRSLRALRGAQEPGWQGRVDRALEIDSVVVWGWNMRRLQRMRVGLEFSDDFEEAAGEEGEP
jgi:DNA-binding PadR family transcriptional regulator